MKTNYLIKTTFILSLLTLSVFTFSQGKGETLKKAIMEATGGKASKQSDSIKLKIPSIAENGAFVPLVVETPESINGKRVNRIVVLVDNNPNPRVLDASFVEGTLPYISSRIRLGKSSKVRAYVVTEGGDTYEIVK
ncbi:MAG: hypothetical protein OEZ36_05685, partial [Spirochaetota bacterium]|nr:hypothetical protein [Spirochaetota bacterium]